MKRRLMTWFACSACAWLCSAAAGAQVSLQLVFQYEPTECDPEQGACESVSGMDFDGTRVLGLGYRFAETETGPQTTEFVSIHGLDGTVTRIYSSDDENRRIYSGYLFPGGALLVGDDQSQIDPVSQGPVTLVWLWDGALRLLDATYARVAGSWLAYSRHSAPSGSGEPVPWTISLRDLMRGEDVFSAFTDNWFDYAVASNGTLVWENETRDELHWRDATGATGQISVPGLDLRTTDGFSTLYWDRSNGLSDGTGILKLLAGFPWPESADELGRTVEVSSSNGWVAWAGDAAPSSTAQRHGRKQIYRASPQGRVELVAAPTDDWVNLWLGPVGPTGEVMFLAQRGLDGTREMLLSRCPGDLQVIPPGGSVVSFVAGAWHLQTGNEVYEVVPSPASCKPVYAPDQSGGVGADRLRFTVEPPLRQILEVNGAKVVDFDGTRALAIQRGGRQAIIQSADGARQSIHKAGVTFTSAQLTAMGALLTGRGTEYDPVLGRILDTFWLWNGTTLSALPATSAKVQGKWLAYVRRVPSAAPREWPLWELVLRDLSSGAEVFATRARSEQFAVAADGDLVWADYYSNFHWRQSGTVTDFRAGRWAGNPRTDGMNAIYWEGDSGTYWSQLVPPESQTHGLQELYLSGAPESGPALAGGWMAWVSSASILVPADGGFTPGSPPNYSVEGLVRVSPTGAKERYPQQVQEVLAVSPTGEMVVWADAGLQLLPSVTETIALPTDAAREDVRVGWADGWYVLLGSAVYDLGAAGAPGPSADGGSDGASSAGGGRPRPRLRLLAHRYGDACSLQASHPSPIRAWALLSGLLIALALAVRSARSFRRRPRSSASLEDEAK